MEEKREEKLEGALLKVALGYQIAEVTEEYAEVNGELKLTKRKKTKKDVPPDLRAVQMLLSPSGSEGYAAWSDEELEAEKQRLLEALKTEPPAPKKVGRCATKSKTTKKKTVKKKGGS